MCFSTFNMNSQEYIKEEFKKKPKQKYYHLIKSH